MQALNSRRAAIGVSSRTTRLRTPLVARAPRQSHVVRVMEIVGEAQWEAEVLKSEKMVLVDFWATWCGPCRLVAPLMDWAEKEYGEHIKVVKLQHTPNPEIIAKYKVYGLPTLMLFKNGELVEGSHREGAVSKPILLKYIQEHVLTSVTA